MRVAIHQPNFLPWIGYFRKLMLCDVFVILDHVQFTKNSYQNRTKIKTPQGEHWLTAPVLTKGRFGQSTKDVEINNATEWGRKLWTTLEANYGKAPFFHEYTEFFERLLTTPRRLLVELNEEGIRGVMGILGIDVRIIRSSEMELAKSGSDLILEICLKAGAEQYVSGGGGRKYMELEAFERAGVSVVFNDFRCPVYPQRFDPFIPNLSIVDLLFNCGPESPTILSKQEA